MACFPAFLRSAAAKSLLGLCWVSHSRVTPELVCRQGLPWQAGHLHRGKIMIDKPCSPLRAGHISAWSKASPD